MRSRVHPTCKTKYRVRPRGLLTSLIGLMGIELSAPDHTTISRRGPHLNLTRRRVPTGEGVHLIIDSTGLSVVGEGEWTARNMADTARAAGRSSIWVSMQRV